MSEKIFLNQELTKQLGPEIGQMLMQILTGINLINSADRQKLNPLKNNPSDLVSLAPQDEKGNPFKNEGRFNRGSGSQVFNGKNRGIDHIKPYQVQNPLAKPHRQQNTRDRRSRNKR